MKIEEVIRIVVIVAVVGTPVFKAIGAAMRRSAERKRAMQAQEFAQNEALRTGRPLAPQAAAPATSPTAGGARAELERMAAQRRQQIEQMRAARRQGVASSRPPTSQVPDVATMQAQRARDEQARLEQARAEQARASETEAARARQEKRRRREATRQAQAEEAARREGLDAEANASNKVTSQLEAARREAIAAQAVAERARLDRGRRALPLLGAGVGGREALRRAIVLREVFGPPVSQRESA